MKLNLVLKKIRAKMKLSQEAMGSMLGVSFTSINRWETAKSIPRPDMVKKIEKLAIKTGIASIENSKITHKPIAFSFFAGAGGFHLGIEKAGFNVVLASDIEPEAEITHKKNWPKTSFICKDIRKITSEEILKASEGKYPDLIVGGPPCQGFSTLGDKLSSDPRNDLFESYAKIIEYFRPKCFLMENVKSFTTMYHGRFLTSVISRFNEIGYKVYYKVLNAADYGVPQFRERVIIFGSLLPHPFCFPESKYGIGKVHPFATVGDAIMDLVNSGNEIANHIPLDHSDVVVRRYEYIPEGGRLPKPSDLPEDIRRTNFGNTYKRLDRSKPALTMVPGNNAFPIHPTLHRSLTPREAARIQTFPDDFIFTGDRRRQCILVGNAVPPLLAEVLGKQVLRHLKNQISMQASENPAIAINDSTSNMTAAEKWLNLDIIQQKPDSFGFMDLFSGAGGFLIGFSKAGWKPVMSVDWNRYVGMTHKKNFPSIPFIEGDLSTESTRNAIINNIKPGSIGVVVGGPPCQGFSIFGKRRFVNTKGYDPGVDPRNKLVYSYIHVIKTVKPRWFVMENVPGFANLDDGLFLNTIIDEFKNIGYPNVEFRILNAADYGVPQLRRRLLIIGNRTGHIIPWPKKKYFPTPKEYQDSYRTVGEVITDLAQPDSSEKITSHIPMNHKPLLVERYKYIEEGKKLNVDLLPKHLKSGYRTEEVKNYSHVFKRLHRDRPSTTMVPGHNAFPIHPWLHRALTVREAARIQTFPDSVEFEGPRQEQCIQVGNAFPPTLSEVIANNILKAEKNGWYPGKTPKSALYSLIETNTDELAMEEE